MPIERPHPTAASSSEPAGQPVHGRRAAADIAGHRELTPPPASRRAAVEETAGALTGTYEPGYLEALREDWPA